MVPDIRKVLGILEIQRMIFEQSLNILEERVNILENRDFIRTNKMILEHSAIY